ncbi:hypothetical protein [Pseudomonas sp.]|uniref:hypothetical protein n=1 Tax=Pseudomonas sp. TaxID=306 RepID=UPI00260AFB25|nr:hypothetical protein [Pseudomonas sp.]
MSRRPELGYFDEAFDLSSPSTYRQCEGELGKARLLPLAAYRSLEFAYLEDERVWTRDWVCVGTQQDVSEVGDLLPFTLGNHGVHVRRNPDGALKGAFNQAQHGGCRVVPDQCQGGTKTRCSFTSCGYSRDRMPIKAVGAGEGDTHAHQYLGLRPERLLPVQVATIGPLIFANIDPNARAFNGQDSETLLSLLAGDEWTRLGTSWREYDCNWKLLAQHLLSVDSFTAAVGEGLDIGCGTSAGMKVAWVFPSLLLLRKETELCVVILQPVALGRTVCRIQVFIDQNVFTAGDQLKDWFTSIDGRGALAADSYKELMRWDLSEHSGAEYPLQSNSAGLWAQQQLLHRLTAQAVVPNDFKLFGNVRNYLI